MLQLINLINTLAKSNIFKHMTPQIILIILYAISLGIIITKHGEDKEGKHNFVVTLISNAVVLGILYWGGFFDVFSK